MATDMFLKIANVVGESTDPDHLGWIDALAWSWGESNSGSAVSPPGPVSMQDLSITTYLDKAGVPLMAACAKGTIFPSALLVAVKPGTTPFEFLRFKIEPVLVTSISSGGSGGEDRFTQNITLNYAKITWTYTLEGSGGGPPIVITRSFDTRL